MLINSIGFVIFSFFVVVLYYLVPRKRRWIVLLTSSYIFYFLYSKKLSIFLILSIFSVFLSGIFIQKQNDLLKDKSFIENKKISRKKLENKKKIFVCCGVLFNVSILLILKYSNFFIGVSNSIFNINIGFVKILLPLGISYYTLQAISYVVDVYRGKYKASTNFFEVSLFLSFFPIISQGPISKFDELTPQLMTGNKIKYENIVNGVALMLWGYFKKIVIADRCAIYVNNVFGNSSYGGIIVLIAIILYTVQIYFEFSGCMDIISGLSKTMGIELATNFERPFFSKNVQEFWRRWHKTLGAWLKDYVFYPVSLSKSSIKITKFSRKKLSKNLAKFVPVAFSLFFVWFLNGFWHGASWKYVFYGLYYYIVMMIALLFKPITDSIMKKLKINKDSIYFSFFQIIRTTFIVLIGMTIFRARSITEAFSTIFSVFKNSTISVTSVGLSPIDFIVIIFGCALLLIYGVLEEKNIYVIDKINKSNLIFRYCVYLILVFSMIIFGIYGPGYDASEFIYGQF